MTMQCASAGVWRSIHATTWRGTVSDATTQNRSSASLVTVRSASRVPPSFSHCVYVMTPGAPSTALAEIQSSTLPASRPCTRNFDMNDMSMTITPSRAARCSSAQVPNHDGLPQVSSLWGSTPAGAYQSAPSQPLTSRKYAPRAARRSCKAERLAPRAVAIDRVG